MNAIAGNAPRTADTPPLRLLVAERDENATESILAHLRNAAITLRPRHLDTLADLHDALAHRTWDLLVMHAGSALGALREVVSAVREHDPHLPVLVLGPHVDGDATTQALREGAADLVPDDDRERLLLVLEREMTHVRDRLRLQRAHAAHEEIAHRIELLLASTEAGVAYVLDGMHVFANGEYLRMFGYADVDDLLGATMLDLVTTDAQDGLKAYLRDIGNEAKPPLRLSCQHRDGSRFEADMTVEPAAYEGESCWQVTLRPHVLRAEAVTPAQVCGRASRRVLDAASTHDAIARFHGDVIAAAGTGTIAVMQWRDRAQARASLGIENTAAVDARIHALLCDAFDEPHLVLAAAEDLELVLLRDLSLENAQTEMAEIGEHIADLIKRESSGAIKVRLAAAVMPLGDEIGSDLACIDDLLRSISAAGTDSPALEAKTGPGTKPGEPEKEQGTGKKQSTDGGKGDTVESGGTEDDVGNGTTGRAGNKAVEANPPDNDTNARATTWTVEAIAQLRADVERCLLQNAFQLMFQPIISVRGDPDELYEVMLYAPSGSAEDSRRPISLAGLPQNALEPSTCSRVDRWLVLQSIRVLAAHRANGHDTRLVIDLSAASMFDREFPQWLAVAIRTARLPADALVFQVSEPDVLIDLRRASAFLQALSTLHFRTAIGHFTGGNDPRAFVSRIGVDFVTLDGSLIAAVHTDAERRARLSRLIDLLQSRGKLTIVPMVATAHLLTTLYNAGANYIQGDYLQEPSPEMDYNFVIDD